MTVADIIAEGIDIHGLAKDKEDRTRRVYELLDQVGLIENMQIDLFMNFQVDKDRE